MIKREAIFAMTDRERKAWVDLTFPIGSTVIMPLEWDNCQEIRNGEIGTVILVQSGGVPQIGVRWEKKGSDTRHSLGGKCEHGHGWWMLPWEITPLYTSAREDENDNLKLCGDIL